MPPDLAHLQNTGVLNVPVRPDELATGACYDGLSVTSILLDAGRRRVSCSPTLTEIGDRGIGWTMRVTRTSGWSFASKLEVNPK
jgi:hypothetical protein